MIDLALLDVWRLRSVTAYRDYGGPGDPHGGVFQVPLDPGSPDRRIRIIASVGAGWDHVSVSWPDRCPTWDEMGAVKRVFFKPEETAMQLHVPVAEHVNCHPHCLHLWRPHAAEIPRPPSDLV